VEKPINTPLQPQACGLCGAKDYLVVSDRDAKSGDPLEIGLCSGCGLVQQTQRPTSEDLQIYYSHHYRTDYKKNYEPKLKYVFRAGLAARNRMRFLNHAQLVETMGGRKFLDVGAGGGEMVYAAQRAGLKAIGIEPNQGYSSFAREAYNTEIATCGLDELQQCGFAIITMFHVLEHMPDPLAVFRRLFGLLDADGHLLVEVPNIEQADASPTNIFFKAHLYYFSKATLLSAASLAFEPIQIEDQGNLRILFRRKSTMTPLVLPSQDTVAHTRLRLSQKGWGEYLTVGGGWRRPFQRLRNRAREALNARGTPLETLERALA